MRKIKEVLRLKYECKISEREIARSCRLSRSTVADYLRRATAAGIRWSETNAISETDIERRLFPAPLSAELGSQSDNTLKGGNGYQSRDDTDRGIVAMLWEDGRALAPTISSRLSISESTVRRRVHSLMASGLCKREVVLSSQERPGNSFVQGHFIVDSDPS